MASYTPIAQGEISMSVAFPTHVWKMPNICKHIIVWLFSHMCAFSHTYVSKSKHVWKIAPRCKYTNVFGFFQTCWVKVKHLPKWTCVVFYTQVWLFSNIFVWKKLSCFTEYSLIVFDGNKELAHFSTILFDLLSLS